jgi:hypothetical protein
MGSGGAWHYCFPDSVEMVRTVVGIEELIREVERAPRQPRRLRAAQEAHALLNSLTICLRRDAKGNIILDLEAPEGQEVGPIYYRIAELLEQLENEEAAT